MFLFLLLPILINVAFITLLERKILGFSQLRLGPNKVRIFGVLQPFRDAIKLFLKQRELNFNRNKLSFYLIPIIIFIILIILWIIIPSKFFSNYWKLSTLLFISFLRVGVYPILLIGWASNSKYAIIGGIRGVAQTISYEIRLALTFILFISFFFSFQLREVKNSILFIRITFPFVLILWLIIVIAETNRTPFDFAEGESELVSGFNIEYASVGFVLIFLREYGIILLFSSLSALLFFNNRIFNFLLSIISVGFSRLWIIFRATFPRYRYDILINLAWKSLLPISLSSLTFIIPLFLLI